MHIELILLDEKRNVVESYEYDAAPVEELVNGRYFAVWSGEAQIGTIHDSDMYTKFKDAVEAHEERLNRRTWLDKAQKLNTPEPKFVFDFKSEPAPEDLRVCYKGTSEILRKSRALAGKACLEMAGNDPSPLELHANGRYVGCFPDLEVYDAFVTRYCAPYDSSKSALPRALMCFIEVAGDFFKLSAHVYDTNAVLLYKKSLAESPDLITAIQKGCRVCLVATNRTIVCLTTLEELNCFMDAMLSDAKVGKAKKAQQEYFAKKKGNVVSKDAVAAAVDPSHYKGYIAELQWIDAMSQIPSLRKPERFIAALELQIRKYLDRNGQKDDSIQELRKGHFYFSYMIRYMANDCKLISATELHEWLKGL